MMLDARNRGFEILLVYIGTENVEINQLELEIGFWRGATTFRKKTFGDDTNAALKIFQSQ